MGFFDFLRGRPASSADPTREWATATGAPAVDVEHRSLGFLRFGDGVEQARTLGRPDRYTDHGHSTCSLDYRSRGFALEFELGKLVDLTYYIGPGGMTPDDPPPAFVTPATPGGLRLTSSVTAERIQSEYGAPTHASEEGDLLTYVRDGFVQEFAFAEDGRLATWTLYLD